MQQMKIKLLLTSALILALSACASVGQPIDLGKVQAFEKGETTKTDVRDSLGSPASSGITSDGETFFIYTFARSRVKASTFIPIAGAFMGGANTDVQTLQLWFDEADVLKNYEFNETTQDVRSGFTSR